MDTAAITTTNTVKPAAVVNRHVKDAFVRTLPPVPVHISYGGTVSGNDVAILCQRLNISVRDVVFKRSPCLSPNQFLWAGIGDRGRPVYGLLQFHLAFSERKVLVSAAISLLGNMNPRTYRLATESYDGVELTENDRLNLIEYAAREAIQELELGPVDVAGVTGLLNDIVDTLNTLSWDD